MSNRIYRTLGTVAMTPKGEWNPEVYYEKLNIVQYNDSSYMATEGVVGEIPSESTKWQLVAGGLREEDIIDNLNSNVSNKPLSAKQGKVLKDSINDSISGETINRSSADNNLQNQINVERTRIDNISSLEEGSTTGDAELQDIRLSYNNYNYSSAGTSVRNQVNELNTRLNNIENLDVTNIGIVISSKVSGKFYNVSTYTYQTYNVYNTFIYPCNEYEKYLITSRITDTNIARAVWLDENDSFIAYSNRFVSGETGLKTDLEVIAPKGAKKLVVSSTIGNETTVKNAKYIKNKLIDVIPKIFNKETITPDLIKDTYYYNISTDKYGTYTGFKSYEYNYDNTKQYIVTTSISGVNQALAVFKDANDNTIGYINRGSKSSLITYNNYLLSVPSGTAKIIIGGYGSNNITKVDCLLIENFSQCIDMLEYVNSAHLERIIDEQEKNPFAWKSYDKGQITFTFDDSLPDIDLVADIFEEYNIPCCMATIPQNLNNITTATGDNETVKQVLTRIQNAGGEILNHGNSPMTSSSTDEQIYNLFVSNRKTLIDNGFNVNGIIRVGGTGSTTFDNKKCEKYLREYYRYSDEYGINLNLPQFECTRTYISHSTNINHTKINQCKNNKTWLIFATHSVNNSEPTSISTTEAILRDTIEYAIQQGVEIVTMFEHYNSYSSSYLKESMNNM